MRKTSLFALFLMAIVLICGTQSCRHREETNPWEEEGFWSDSTNNGGGSGSRKEKIDIYEWPVQVISQMGGQTHLKMKTTGNWTATVAPECQGWVKVNPASGEAGDNIMTILISENNTYDERNASVTIACGSARQLITIVQKQLDAIIVSSNKIEIDEKEQTFEIEVKANVDYTWDISKNAQNWLSTTISKGLTSQIIKFKAKQNNDVITRHGVITFSSTTTVEEVDVYQRGEKQTIVISNKYYNMPQEGGDIKVEIQSNTEYYEVAPICDWLMKDLDRNQSAYTIYYKVLENLNKEKRSNYIVFTSTDRLSRDTIYVTQEAFVSKFAVESEKELNFPFKAGEFSIDVISNSPYTISAPDWIIGDKSAERGSRTHTFKYDQNPLYEPRSGKMVLSNEDGSITETIKITQDAKVDKLELTSNPALVFDRFADNRTAVFDASERWTATVSEGARTWLKTDPASAEDTVTQFDISVTDNKSFDTRSGIITITCGNLKKEISVTQHGIEPTLEILSGLQGLAVDYEGGTVEIQVKANCDYYISIPSWLKGDLKGTSGTNRHVYQVPKYSGDGDRNGEIVVTSSKGNLKEVIKVTQSCFVDMLTILDVNFTNFVATGQDALVRFDCNKPWSATVSDNAKDWIFLNPKDGGLAGKNVNLVVTSSMNMSFKERKGSVTITSGKNTEVLEFTQAAADPMLDVNTDKNLWTDNFKGGSKVIATITSNVDYTITKPSWITGLDQGMAGITYFEFKFTENTAYEDRSGKIVFHSAKYNITKEIEVFQTKKIETLGVNPTWLEFARVPLDKTLTVVASDPWTAEINASGKDWLTMTSFSGGASPKGAGIVVTATSNNNFGTRTAEITFTCGREVRKVSVSQEGNIPVLKITSEAEIKNINYKGGEITVKTSSNCDYDIVLPSWIKGETSGKAGDNVHKFTVDLNDSYTSRTESIKFENQALEVSAKVPVTQNQKTDEVKILSVPDAIISEAGGSIDIKFWTNGDWSISGDQNLSFSQKSGGAGEHTVTVTAEPNHTTMALTPKVTIKCGTASERIELSQNAEKPYLKVQTYKEVNIVSEGGPIEVTVSSNTKFTFTLPSWISCSIKSVEAGTRTISFKVAANTLGTIRKGDIEFKCISFPSVTDKVTIIQAKAEVLKPGLSNGNDIQTPQN